MISRDFTSFQRSNDACRCKRLHVVGDEAMMLVSKFTSILLVLFFPSMTVSSTIYPVNLSDPLLEHIHSCLVIACQQVCFLYRQGEYKHIIWYMLVVWCISHDIRVSHVTSFHTETVNYASCSVTYRLALDQTTWQSLGTTSP